MSKAVCTAGAAVSGWGRAYLAVNNSTNNRLVGAMLWVRSIGAAIRGCTLGLLAPLWGLVLNFCGGLVEELLYLLVVED